MKKPASLIARFWQKLGGKSGGVSATADSGKEPPKAKSVATPGAPEKRRPRFSGIESLEGRIAPATLVNASTISFVDLDGDLVTVKFSKDIFTATSDAALNTLVNNVFKFSTGSVVTGTTPDPGTPQQLQLIDLTKVPTIGVGSAAKSLAAGVSITVTSEQAGATPGDGLTNVGFINASSSLNSFGLGKVTIDGDLGQIDCGESKTAVGLKALKVNSLGAVAGTQAAGSANIESKITGAVGSLTVLTDVKNSYIHVVNGSGFSGVKAVGKIGKIDIGGALIGNAAVAASSDNTGVIQTDSSIGSVKIGSGGADDGILGGGGRNAGSIIAAGKIGNITIDGNIIGHDGANSGSILGNGGIGSVKVSGDLKIAAGATQSGAGLSASIESGGNIGSVKIDGSILAGGEEGSGTISADGTIGSVSIGGDVVGKGDESGGIYAGERIGNVVIGGDLRGGADFFSGFIQSNGSINSVKIGGDLESSLNSTGERNAVIVAVGSINKVAIEGSIIGGKGISSGSIHAGIGGEGGLGNLSVGKKIVGGDGENSGSVTSAGKIGKLTVTGEGDIAVQGGLGRFSAAIYSGSGIEYAKLTGNVLGGGGLGSGGIQTVGILEKLEISGDLRGGDGIGSASVLARDNFDRGLAGNLGKISIACEMIAGRGAESAAIKADGDLASLKVGAITVGTFETGAAGAASASINTGLGSINRGDVGSISVGGEIDGLTADHSLMTIRGSLEKLVAIGGISNGEIHVADQIGSITTGKSGRGSVTGHLENVLITAGGLLPTSAKQALSIAKITINGNVAGSQILAGYDLDTVGTNGDAQIGSVVVDGNWSASDLVAGGLAVNGQFGDTDDAAIPTGSSEIVSRVASLVISGTVTGTDAVEADHFGFIAQEIGTVKIAGSTSPVLPADVSIRPLPIA